MSRRKFLPKWWWWGVPLSAASYLLLAYGFPAMAAGAIEGGDLGGSTAARLIDTFSRAFAPYAPVLVLLWWGLQVSQAVKDGWRLNRQTGIDSIRELGWREFEDLLAEAYRRQGYRVETTPRGADGGVDLVLHGVEGRVLVQAKQWRSRSVGVGKVRELLGVMTAQHADGAVLVTCGSVTGEARTFAVANAIGVVEGPELEKMIRSVQPVRSSPRSAPGSGQSPRCPSCRSTMVRKVARRGPRKGQPFWGCSRFPDCRGIVDARR